MPRPCAFCKGGYDAACTIELVVPSGLHRTYGAHHLHFITSSGYHRLPFLGAARSRDTFLTILEQTRQRYRFVVVGYVIMPEQRTAAKAQAEEPAPTQSVWRGAEAQSVLAGALLRLQRMDHEEARGEAPVYAS